MSEVFEVAIGRTRVGWGARVSLDPAAAAASKEPVDDVPRIARTLAVAHVMQRMIDNGEVRDQAELARVVGFTRARVTQLLDLTLLAPDIQEALLLGHAPLDTRVLRPWATQTWRSQRARWRALVGWS
jgi:hypothetical protein